MHRNAELRQRLVDEMAQVKTVDCHSHTMLKREYYQTGGLDLFSLMSYFNRDIVTTAGENLRPTTGGSGGCSRACWTSPGTSPTGGTIWWSTSSYSGSKTPS